MSLIEELTRRMPEKGFTPKSLSLAAGLNETYVRDILVGKSKNPATSKVAKLADLLECTLEELSGRSNAAKPEAAYDPTNPLGIAPAEEVRYAPGVTLPPPGPRDVPIYGTAQCGPEGEFVWDGNSNLAVDIVPRPAALATLRNVFAVYAVGDSMMPWCEPGDTVFIHPDREPRNGDYVLVEFRDHPGDEQKKAVIKRLVGRRHGAVIVSQYNPPKEREFPEELVEHVWRVIGWQEALGTRTR